MTHLEFYYNSTPSASVSNWCGFCYTSYKNYSKYPLTQEHTLSSNSLWGLLCLIDILNYFSVIYACNTQIAKISRLELLSQGESYLSILKLLTAKTLRTYSIWSIFYFFMGLCLFPISSPLTLNTSKIWRACVLCFSTSFLSMPYTTITLLYKFIYLSELKLYYKEFQKDISHYKLRT
jgi:hypothetical protein